MLSVWDEVAVSPWLQLVVGPIGHAASGAATKLMRAQGGAALALLTAATNLQMSTRSAALRAVHSGAPQRSRGSTSTAGALCLGRSRPDLRAWSGSG